MLARKHRLGKHEINKVFRKGKRIRSQSLMLITQKSDNVKVGVVIGKKCFPRAVDRNKAKRRIRSIVRELFNKIPKDTKIIIYTLPDIQKLDYKGIQKEITKLINKISSK